SALPQTVAPQSPSRQTMASRQVAPNSKKSSATVKSPPSGSVTHLLAMPAMRDEPPRALGKVLWQPNRHSAATLESGCPDLYRFVLFFTPPRRNSVRRMTVDVPFCPKMPPRRKCTADMPPSERRGKTAPLHAGSYRLLQIATTSEMIRAPALPLPS